MLNSIKFIKLLSDRFKIHSDFLVKKETKKSRSSRLSLLILDPEVIY